MSMPAAITKYWGCLLAVLIGVGPLHGSSRQLTSSTTVPASPSVMATVVHVDGTLKLAVLWRGTPRWYLGRGSRSGSGGGGGTTFWISEQYGDIGIDMSFDTARDIVTLGGSSINVPHGANVLLVDGVGSAAGPQLAASLTVDAGSANTNPTRGSLGPFLSISPQVLAFLLCDDAPARSTPAARAFGYCSDLR